MITYLNLVIIFDNNIVYTYLLSIHDNFKKKKQIQYTEMCHLQISVRLKYYCDNR